MAVLLRVVTNNGWLVRCLVGSADRGATDAPVAVDGHRCHPGPDEDDGHGEDEIADGAAPSGRHHREPAEEGDTGEAREGGPAAPSLHGIPAGEDEAGRGDAREPDAPGSEVEHPVPRNR